MCNREQKTETLLQQVALSLGNITFAIDNMLEEGQPPSIEQVRQALVMIRNHTEASCERIYAHHNPSHKLDVPMVNSPLTTTLASLSGRAA